MSMLLLFAAAAVTPELRSDFECMTLFSIGAASTEKDEERSAAVAGTMYFFGRIDKASPGIDLAAELTATGKAFEAMTPKQIEDIGKRCDTQVQSVGNRLVAAGKAIDGK